MNRIFTKGLIFFKNRLWLIILLMQFIMVSQAYSLTSSDSLVYGSPEEVCMSSKGLNKALQLYKDCISNGDLVGAVLLVSRNGHVVLHEAVGLRDKENNLAMEKDTLFRMASMTKPIISTGILILAERGKLDLNDPVYKYIPSFGKGLARKITIRQLLNHTSGFRFKSIYLFPLIERSEKYPNAPNLQIEVARFGEVGPDIEPGTSYSYSNSGYNTLGAIIEIVSGKTYEDFMRDEIHAPLGAVKSTHNSGKINFSQLPVIYQKIHGKWYANSRMGIEYLPIVIPAGSLFSTAFEYAKFCHLFLNGGKYDGKQILNEKSIQMATTNGVFTKYPYPTPSQLQARKMIPPWYYRRSIGGYEDLGVPERLSLDSSYGFGWVLARDRIFSHGSLFGNFVWIDPGRRIIGLILTQSIGGKNPGVEFMEAVNASVIK